MSRHLNDRPALVIFDRAARKLGSTSCTRLADALGIDKAQANLGIVIAVP